MNRNIIKDMKKILKLAATVMLGFTLSAADENTTACLLYTSDAADE